MPDYMFLLESRLSPEQRAAMVRVQELALAIQVNVYLVGGAVRDLISGMPLRDLDFTIEGNPFRIARELEKGGARILEANEKLRHVELIFAGDADGSIAAARDEVYARPGTRPEIRWSTIMEDLRRRDFSLNAIAISLNLASRGLLLDPTNGLADLEKHEVRALSIHSFTNQPVRLLRALRYSARMGFKLESRTGEWFALALERGLDDLISPEDVGKELRQLAREEKPSAVLKLWEARGLIHTIHEQLARRHPNYEALQRLIRVRDDMVAGGFRPRLLAPATRAVLSRLKSREQSAALSRMEFRSAEKDEILHLDTEAKKVVKVLASRKTARPRDAFDFLQKLPLGMLAYILAELSNSKALGKIRMYLYKWRPLHQALPQVEKELEAMGVPRSPKFDKVIHDLFELQLLGKGRKPEDRTKLLRKLAGIKEPPKRKAKEEKKKAAKAISQEAKKKAKRAEAEAIRKAAETASEPGAATIVPEAGAAAPAAPPKGAKAAPALEKKAGKPAKAAARPVSRPLRAPRRPRRKARSMRGGKAHPPRRGSKKSHGRKRR